MRGMSPEANTKDVNHDISVLFLLRFLCQLFLDADCSFYVNILITTNEFMTIETG
jgi:hypothetical protein